MINTNSVKSIQKAIQLKTTIQSNNPDIIFLVETKLDENYATHSFLPPNYEAIRKDKNVHGGGVLIAFRDIIVAEPLQNLNSNCEIVWIKIHFVRNKCIYFASYYADWDKLKDDIDKLNREYFDMDPNSQDIDINWTFFHERLTTLIKNNIPRRYTKAKTHLPWITRELIRMQRRRSKSHQKAKQTGLNSDWEKFKELRKQATKALAKSYKDYVNNHIGD